jgi:hypothetical protein
MANQVVAALVFSAACTGCQWSGFGFSADGPEMPRLKQVR